jgi:hypothetical protein
MLSRVSSSELTEWSEFYALEAREHDEGSE